MPRTTKVAPFLGAFALAVSLSACGGDDDSDTVAGGDGSPGSSETSQDGGDGTGDSDENERDDAGTPDGGDDAGAYCAALEPLTPESLDISAVIDDPSTAAALADTLPAVVDAAPDEVKGDWYAVADAYAAVASAEIDMTDPEAMNDPVAADALRQLDSVATNIDNVSRHATLECGTDLGHG